MPRYLVVTRACYLRKTWARRGHERIDGPMILVEEDDGTRQVKAALKAILKDAAEEATPPRMATNALARARGEEGVFISHVDDPG